MRNRSGKEKIVAIIDCGSGNLHSVRSAFESVAENRRVLVTTDPAMVRRADYIVLPGQGVFAQCLAGIESVSGLWDALEEAVITHRKPFLGICVGMQLMADHSVEAGTHQGFGWIAGTVRPVVSKKHRLKIPHMGWNDLTLKTPHPVLDKLPDPHVYFVHSYQFVCENPAHRIAAVSYKDVDLTAMIARDNMIGVQFHPEKSQKTGLTLLKNFLSFQR